jgi:hypothetical protein
VKAFADAAFSLSEIGDLSAPARNQWLGRAPARRDHPERHTPRPEAIADLRVKRFRAGATAGLHALARRALVKTAKVERNDALLEQVQVDSLIGM